MKMNRLASILSATTVTGAQYLQSSTLHGFKYFREDHLAERLFWLVVHILNICCASLFCFVLCERFLENPSILEVVPPTTDRSETYPVITLCPPDRIPLQTAITFARKLALPDGVDQSYVTDIVPQLAVALAPSYIKHKRQDLLLLDLLLSFNNLTYLEALKEVAPSCEDFILRCSWFSDGVPCNKLFRRVVSRFGICCSFNRPINQNMQKIKSELTENFNLLQKSADLNLILNVSNVPIIHPSVDCAKFKIEDISMNARKNDYRYITPNHEYWIGMSKVQVATVNMDDDLVAKNCEKLNPAKPYGRHICQVECILRAMETRCGCVSPMYPMLGRQPCPPSRAPCLHSILTTIESRIMSNKSCQCKRTCDESQIYTDDVAAMTLSARAFTLDPFYNGVTESMAVLRIYKQIYRSSFYNLEPTVTWLTLLSSLGGVFNMFLGLGVVSVIEVLFYLTVRLYNNVVSYRNSQ